MKERVEEIMEMSLGDLRHITNITKVCELVKDLWAENQTIVAEYKTLSESHASANETNLVMGNRLLEMQEKERKYREALEYYADEEHYEETQGLNGIRPPGVLKDRGGKAKQALSGE